MAEKQKRVKVRGGFVVYPDLVHLCLSTHVPKKWIAVDLETGDVWQGQEDGGWRRPVGDAIKRALNAMISDMSQPAGPRGKR